MADRDTAPEVDEAEGERISRKRPFFEEACVAERSAKTGVENSLHIVRECFNRVLSSWWITNKSRHELEEALAHLALLEAEFAQHRPSRIDEKPKSSLEELKEELQVGKTKSISRRWLVETFTEGHGLSASRRSSIVSENTPLSPRSSLKAAASDAAASEVDEDELYGELEMTDVCDIMVRLDSEPEVSKVMAGVGKLDFDVPAFAELPGIKGRILQALFQQATRQSNLLQKLEDAGALQEGEGFRRSLHDFLGKMEETYRSDVPYHTAVHAADTMMTMEWFLRSQTLVHQVSDVDHFMALVSCAIHDVGHPGRNNLFHSKTLSPLAITYNDKSILENMHVATAFEVMKKESKLNWVALLSGDYIPAGKDKPMNLQSSMRRGMIEIVLGTDMAKHNQHHQSLTTWAAKQDDPEATPAEKAVFHEKIELLEALAHAADISNPCKPRKMMLYWTQRVVEEFWAQGDEESRLSVEISPMCDRSVGEKSVPKQQIGFIDFVIAPFYKPLAQLLPEAQEAMTNMADNRSFWQGKESEQATFAELFGKSGEED